MLPKISVESQDRSPCDFIWFDGELRHLGDVMISPLSRSLHYGLGVFDGIRVYDSEKGLVFLNLEKHLKRFKTSADEVGLSFDFSLNDLRYACIDVIRKNDLKNSYLRPLVFSGTGELGLGSSDTSIHTMVCALPWNSRIYDKGISLHVSGISRLSYQSSNLRAKITGQYTNLIFAKQQAKTYGYDEALLLSQEGLISEASGANIFFVIDDTTYTPPDDGNIFPGITRKFVIDHLRREGYRVCEDVLDISVIERADEAFITGTAVEITEITQIGEVCYTESYHITNVVREAFERQIEQQVTVISS
jgi:branched-chain amino acid aminotransferase